MSTRSDGQLAERRAAKFLEENYGYKILTMNYACRLGEVDIIAEEAGILCFVEVRTRTTSKYGEAIESISPQKRRRIALTAHHFIVTKGFNNHACRFDVVTIQDRGEPQLLKNAFNMTD